MQNLQNTKENRKKWVEKVRKTMKIANYSLKTYQDYRGKINHFLNYYPEDTIIKKLKEDDIAEYLIKNFINLNRAKDTLNLSICAIRYFYSVCFDKELSRKKLPNSKVTKRLPVIVPKKDFFTIFNNEKEIEHKCWIILGFCCGLRVDEVATLRIENIYPAEHKVKILGKGNKERFTILPDIVTIILRIYCKKYNITKKNGYLFSGNGNKEHINPNSIDNYFHNVCIKHNLSDKFKFHSLRHGFATYFIMNGGNILTLKDMLGHSSLSSTIIYIHLAQNFNELEGIKYA